MKFFQLFPLVVPCRSVFAVPLSHTSTVTAKTYTPLVVVSVSLFFLVVVFLAIKLVYMKHRRIGTIHAPPGAVRSIPTSSNLSSSTSGLGFGDKQGNRHRGLWVGCLGSPTWETNLTSKLGGATGQRSSFAYRLHTRSPKSKHSGSGSRLTKSTVFTGYSGDADQLVLSFGSSRIPPCHGGSSSKARCPAQRHNSHPRYGDFGEFHGARWPGGGVPQVARRASPSSIRLVDGPSHSNQVEYAFLAALPPNATAASPLMGTRDSFQLSRCALRCDRRPVPPMPLFLPFYLPRGSGSEALESRVLQACEYLPPLRFSPLASAARVFHSQYAPSSRVPDPDESRNVAPCLESASSSKTHPASNARSLTSPLVARETPMLHSIQETNTRSNHKRSQSCRGLAIGGSSQRTTLVTDEVPLEDKRHSGMQTGVLRTPGSSRDGSVIPKKPLKSCLRQNSVVLMVCSPDSTLTPLISETSSLGDQVSFPDVDIGIPRLRWNDKVRSCHTKKDSIALVP